MQHWVSTLGQYIATLGRCIGTAHWVRQSTLGNYCHIGSVIRVATLGCRIGLAHCFFTLGHHIGFFKLTFNSVISAQTQHHHIMAAPHSCGTTLLLRYTIAVLHYCCTTLLLHNTIVTRLYRCTTLLLYYAIAVLHYCCTTLLLCHPIAVPH